MTQKPHTPGPWKGDKGSWSRPIRNESGEPFAWVDFENDADYVLTLAAPDMLETCRTGHAWLERWASHVGNCAGGNQCTCGLTAITHELSFTIAKATGETK